MALRARTITALVVALLFVVTGASSARAQGAKGKIAVLGLEPHDAGTPDSQARTAALASALTEALRSEAAKAFERYEIAPNSNRDLSEVKLLADCFDERKECMVQIGKDVGADHLVFGRIEKAKTGYNITLRHLDVQRGVLVKQLKDQVLFKNATDEHVRGMAPDMFAELMQLPRDSTLTVRSNTQVGRVLIDGQPRAELAAGTAVIEGLSAGKHVVAVESDGYRRWEGEVDLKAGQPQQIDVTLAPEQAVAEGPAPVKQPGKPGRPGGIYRKLTWAGAVLTVGGVTAFTITGMKVRKLEDDKDDALAEAAMMGTEIFGPDVCADADAKDYQPVMDICDDGKKYATMTNVLIGVTAGLAVATGVFAYKGYIAPGDGGDPEAPSDDAGPVTILPTVHRHGVGATAIFEF